MDMKCPNCGHQLVSHRTDRQAMGNRDVVMQWNICTRCRHVALGQWSFEDSGQRRTEVGSTSPAKIGSAAVTPSKRERLQRRLTRSRSVKAIGSA